MSKASSTVDRAPSNRTARRRSDPLPRAPRADQVGLQRQVGVGVRADGDGQAGALARRPRRRRTGSVTSRTNRLIWCRRPRRRRRPRRPGATPRAGPRPVVQLAADRIEPGRGVRRHGRPRSSASRCSPAGSSNGSSPGSTRPAAGHSSRTSADQARVGAVAGQRSAAAPPDHRVGGDGCGCRCATAGSPPSGAGPRLCSQYRAYSGWAVSASGASAAPSASSTACTSNLASTVAIW